MIVHPIVVTRFAYQNET